ncbi:hypothetical protein DOY81_005195 [Sarcophaga bullata]|nr:hypothetical protein DOY81_005195 [Sarcophaga bullata]
MSLLSSTGFKLNEYAAATMVYFERHKLIEIAKASRKILVECALLRPSDAQEWIGKNIKRIANEIYQDCLQNGKHGVIKSLHLSKSFVYRIVLFGRPGSGRKTQATYLVNRFNVVIIDAEILIYKYLRGNDEKPNDPLDRELQRAFYYDNCQAKAKALLNIIGRRVLENDCLSRGWVLLNYVHSLEDLKDLMENFVLPPNKLVYMKCPEMLCMRRLMAMPDLGKPSHNYTYYIQEMRYFKQQERSIKEYLTKRHEATIIDAEDISENVKTAIFAALVKVPYVLGFQQNSKY